MKLAITNLGDAAPAAAQAATSTNMTSSADLSTFDQSVGRTARVGGAPVLVAPVGPLSMTDKSGSLGVPTLLPVSRIQVSAGAFRSCAPGRGGVVRCRGGNGYDHPGDGETIQRNAPVATQLPVSNLATLSTSVLGGGLHTIQAAFDGNASSSPGQVAVDQTFDLASQTITFPALANTAFTSAPPVPAATASSQLTVAYASATPLVCSSTSGGAITFLTTGTCTIEASQAGDGIYDAAIPVSRSFVVRIGTNVIDFPALADTAFTSPAPIPAATASSGLAVTYGSATTDVCTVTSGGAITFVKTGTCTIWASQAGNANIEAATSESRSFTVTPGAAASITVNGGNGQSAVIGSAFDQPLTVVVKDASGNTVPNVSVTFVPPLSGAGGVFVGGPAAVTDASGVATAPAFTANATVGAYVVAASVAGVAAPANFSLTNTASPTETAVSSSLNPSVYGQSVTFTARITSNPDAPAPTGTVTLNDTSTATSLGTLTLTPVTQIQVSAGSNHTCSLGNDGRVFCWGQNDVGQLGSGVGNASLTPVLVQGANDVTSIDVGYTHACSVRSDKTVECWGNNSRGQLGIGSTVNSSTPVAVSGLTDVKAVAAGVSHTCSVGTDGQVKCWGDYGFGILGNGTDENSSTPISMSGLSDVVAISAGFAHSCALTSAGDVKCWGNNTYGQLGDGSNTNSSTPVLVAGLSSVVAISSGAAHSCALASSGTVKCWGDNSVQQLGNGTTIGSPTPVSVLGAVGVVAIDSGTTHSCALDSNDLVKCWGNGDFGQLGDGTNTRSSMLVQAKGLFGVGSLSAGDKHSCALTRGGTVKCWGDNSFGQIGDLTRTGRLVPVAVQKMNASTAAVSTSTLMGGTHTIEASFAGDGRLNSSSSTFVQTVDRLANVITFPALANTAFTSVPPIPAATASSNLAVSYASTTPLVCSTTSGGAIRFIKSGTCTIAASQPGNGIFAAATIVDRSFSVTPGINVITFPVLANTTFTGAPPIPAASASSGLAVTYASATQNVCAASAAGAISFIATGTCTITASQPGDANFLAASSVNRSFTVAPGTNVITFPPLANTAFTSAPPIPAASASSSLAVTYASTTPLVCSSTNGGAISFVKTGTCTIQASQPGNANFVAATGVSRSFTVTPGTNVITFPALANTAFTSPAPVPAATASSNHAVSYASTTPTVCTASSSGAISFFKTGTCTITASQPGNTNYLAAIAADRSFSITPGVNIITFPALANTAFTSAPPIPAATASSNLAVSYASTTPTVCTASSAGAISFVKTGTCTIAASQTGDGNFAAASAVNRSFSVTPGINVITFPPLANTAFTSPAPVPAATASSSLAVTYTSTTRSVCLASSAGVISFVATGTCTILASQAGNANYGAAISASRSFQVTPGANVIVFPALVDTPINATPPVPAASASSGLAVNYSSTTTSVCTTTGSGTIAFVAPGLCSITAAQPGNATYTAAMPVVRSFNVLPLAAVTLTSSASTVGYGAPVTFTARLTARSGGTPTGTVTFRDGLATLGAATLVNGVASFTTSTLEVGTRSITAAYGGSQTHVAGVSSPLAQIVAKGPTMAKLAVSPGLLAVGSVVTLQATLVTSPAPTSAATGAMVFRSGSTVIGSAVLLNGSATLTLSTLPAGGHSVTAAYAGDARFLPATSVAVPLTVERSCKDLFAGATALTEATGTASGSTLSATAEAGERRHGGDTGAVNSLWCRWTAPASGRVSIDTSGSTFDTTLAVYTGASLAQVVEIASNDNIDANTRQSRVAFDAVQGTIYSIAIDGAGAALGSYVLNWTQTPASPQLMASVLPNSRSVVVGTTATAFATLINTGSAIARSCGIALPVGFPAAFSFQTTDASNALTGSVDRRIDLAPGASQSFVFGITPTVTMEATEIPLVFACGGTQAATSVSGLNRFTLSAAATPSPDIIAVVSTLSNDGTITIPVQGTGVFTAASLNIGVAGSVTVKGDDGGRNLPLGITLCRSDPATGACLAGTSPTGSIRVAYGANQTVTFTIFVRAAGPVADDPALNRIQLRWKTDDGIARGTTSVAVRTR